MRPPRWVLLVVAALVLAPVLAPGAAADACPARIQGALASGAYQDCTIEVAGDANLPAGAALSIHNVTLRFTGASTFQVAGAFTASESDIVAAIPAATFALRLDPSATGAITSSRIRGASSLTVRGAGVTLSHVTVSDAATAVAVDGADPVLDSFRFTKSTVGIRATGAAHPRLLSSTFDEDVPTQIAVVPGATGAAATTSITVQDTPVNAARVTLEATARLFIARAAVVTVQGAGATGAVIVRGIDRDGIVQDQAAAAGSPMRSHLDLPVTVQNRTATRALTPYRVAASAGRIVNFQDSNLADPSTAISLILTTDDDAEPPQWPSQALAQTDPRPGFSRDAAVHLAWQPPAETGSHANRGLARYEVLLDCASPCAPALTTLLDMNAALRDLPEGEHRARVRAVDLAGNAAESAEARWIVDRTPPQLTSKILDVETNDAGVYARTFRVELTSSDSGSGQPSVSYRIGDGAVIAYTAPVPFAADGNYTVRAVAEDPAGNTRVLDLNVIRDTRAPTIQASLSPALAPGSWSARPLSLAVAATDDLAGVLRTRDRIDAADWRAAEAMADLELAPGRHQVLVESVDRAGNTATTILVAGYDPKPPSITTNQPAAAGRGGWALGAVNVTVTATDDVSEVRESQFRLDGGSWNAFQNPIRITRSGDHLLEVRATDAAGNVATANRRVKVDLEDPAPPQATWTPTEDGRLRGEWARAPAFDTPSGIARVSVEENVQGVARLLTEVPVAATGVTLESLADGSHVIRLRVEDAAGRQASTAWMTVSLSGAARPESVPSTHKVRGAATLSPGSDGDLSEVRYYVEGQLLAAVGEAPFTYTWDTSAVKDGDYEVRTVMQGKDGILRQDVEFYQVRNAYAAIAADNAVPFAGVLLIVIAAGVAEAIIAVYSRRNFPKASRVLSYILLGVVAFLLVPAALAPPRYVAPAHLVTAWGVLACATAALLIVQWLRFAMLRRRVARRPVPLAPGAPRDIDFDRPWKEGRV